MRVISELRSQRWYADPGMRGFAHRQRTQQMGLRREEFLGKPVIAVVNTWSELSPCHFHLRDRAEAVKRGVWQAGGYPVELPALSVGEVLVKPSTMLYRNFLAMETEELLRSHNWPGNVRELASVIQTACMIAEGPEILRSDLSIAKTVQQARGPFNEDLLRLPREQMIREVEKIYYGRLKQLYNNNMTKMAKRAEMTVEGVRQALLRLGLRD